MGHVTFPPGIFCLAPKPRCDADDDATTATVLPNTTIISHGLFSNF